MKILLKNMKLPKTSLYESLLDDFDDIDKSFDPKRIVVDWIKANFKVDGLKISDNINNDGIYEVDAKDVFVTNKNITSLTNELFIWKEIKYNFNCSHCDNLTSLKGAPEKVGGSFNCDNCKSLKTLEGAPEKVGRVFNCFHCKSLKSLKGAPKEVGDNFYCDNCKSLKSKDLPETTKVKGKIYK